VEKECGFSVQEIKLCKNLRLKGQAFVVLKKDTGDSQDLVKSLNTRMMFGKPLHVQHAYKDSDSAIFSNESDQMLIKLRKERRMKRNTRKVSKKRSLEEDSSSSVPPSDKKRKILSTIPHKILLLTGLPKSVHSNDLNDIFSKFHGFLNANYVSIRNLALVEFETDADATECMKSLGEDPEINGVSCNLTFAKK